MKWSFTTSFGGSQSAAHGFCTSLKCFVLRSLTYLYVRATQDFFPLVDILTVANCSNLKPILVCEKDVKNTNTKKKSFKEFCTYFFVGVFVRIVLRFSLPVQSWKQVLFDGEIGSPRLRLGFNQWVTHWGPWPASRNFRSETFPKESTFWVKQNLFIPFILVLEHN